jgi:hypothetical protein
MKLVDELNWILEFKAVSMWKIFFREQNFQDIVKKKSLYWRKHHD